MSATCPDCGRPIGNPQLCATMLCDSVWGDSQCQTFTIAKLRLELAAAKASSELSTAERAVVAKVQLLSAEHGDPLIHAAWVERYPNTEKRRHDDTEAENMFEAFEDGWIACLLALRAQKAEG